MRPSVFLAFLALIALPSCAETGEARLAPTASQPYAGSNPYTVNNPYAGNILPPSEGKDL
jgi:hypothetical protein